MFVKHKACLTLAVILLRFAHAACERRYNSCLPVLCGQIICLAPLLPSIGGDWLGL